MCADVTFWNAVSLCCRSHMVQSIESQPYMLLCQIILVPSQQLLKALLGRKPELAAHLRVCFSAAFQLMLFHRRV